MKVYDAFRNFRKVQLLRSGIGAKAPDVKVYAVKYSQALGGSYEYTMGITAFPYRLHLENMHRWGYWHMYLAADSDLLMLLRGWMHDGAGMEE